VLRRQTPGVPVAIDRDAESIVAGFTARLRRTIDLDTVQGDLAGVVHEAFEPAHVSVWLPGASTPDK
jgi:hypothetical protein